MTLFQTTITINGTAYNEAAQLVNGLVVDGWGWDLDGDESIEFHEEGPNVGNPVAPSFVVGQVVVLALASSNVARGIITGIIPEQSEAGWIFSYRVRGQKFMADKIYITAVDGTGRMVFNDLPTDPEDYAPSLAGQTVGQIIAAVLAQHSTQLAAISLATDATTASQLAALTLVPNDPVYFTGRLLSTITSALRLWAKNVAVWITPAGKIRFSDVTAFSGVTLTEGTDPLTTSRLSVDVSETATRVVVRGKGRIFPVFLKLSDGHLAAAWSGAQQTAWKITDFTQPNDAYDYGTCSVTSATSVNVTSHDAALTWPVNFWNGRQAWIHLIASGGTGLTFNEERPVTASAVHTAGSTTSITLGFPLDTASGYNSYKLVGRAGPLTGGAGNDRVDVWRLFDLVTTGNYIKQHLSLKFPAPVAFVGYYGDSSVSTSYPMAVIVWPGGATFPATFKVDPVNGQIRFDNPVVENFNTSGNLAAGGAAVVAPADIYVMLAYSRGALTATYPADSGGLPVYSGQAYSLFGYEQTEYFDVDSWIYQGDQSQLDTYAQAMHAALSVPIFNQTIGMLGADSQFFSPGKAVNVAGASWTTGQESIAVPVRSFNMRYVNGANGVLYRTSLGCNSRRNPNTGDRYYLHPTQLDQLYRQVGGYASFSMSAGFDSPIAGMVDTAGPQWQGGLFAGQAGKEIIAAVDNFMSTAKDGDMSAFDQSTPLNIRAKQKTENTVV